MKERNDEQAPGLPVRCADGRTRFLSCNPSPERPDPVPQQPEGLRLKDPPESGWEVLKSYGGSDPD